MDLRGANEAEYVLVDVVARAMFDEVHNPTWSVDPETARRMQPSFPANSSYALAARAMRSAGVEVVRNTAAPLSLELLRDFDILVVLQPSSEVWERTTQLGSPIFTDREISAIVEWVNRGGSLLVASEYENDKYENNLNDVLAPLGFKVLSCTVEDRKNLHGGSHTWVLADTRSSASSFVACASQLCFYRAGLVAGPPHSLTINSFRDANPAGALLAAAFVGEGRVAVLADTDIFGDEFINQLDHLRLWESLVAWLSTPAGSRSVSAPASREIDVQLQDLVSAVDQLAAGQNADGSAQQTPELDQTLGQVQGVLAALSPELPHEAEYFRRVVADLEAWKSSGYSVPDFSWSLAAFKPQAWREDETTVVSVFPQSTPNGAEGVRFEAIAWRIVWPSWLSDYNRSEGGPLNQAFVPGELLHYTGGYDSECAVLFPSIVSALPPIPKDWGTIFCSRESARFRVFGAVASQLLHLNSPAELEMLLSSPRRSLAAYALWDLIHDSAHFKGHLPLVPFLEGVPQPYWMGAVEELRVDLKSVEEGFRLQRSGLNLGQDVVFCILIDRLFRFPIVSPRVKDYDGLAGQILFGKLYTAGVLSWANERLVVDWDAVVPACQALRLEIDDIYERGVNRDHIGFWSDLHRFVSGYVKPSNGSNWADRLQKGSIGVVTDAEAIALQLPDEFPLNHFYGYLQPRVMAKVLETERTW